MRFDTQQDARLQVEGWATPAPGFTLDQLIGEMDILGNPVLEIDRARNRIKIAHIIQKGLLG